MKKAFIFKKAASLVTAAALLFSVFTLFAFAAEPAPVIITGTITEQIDNNTIRVEADHTGDVVILNITEKTYVIDAETGTALPFAERKTDKITAYYGPVTTRSMPPIANAAVILIDVKDGVIPPMYGVVEKSETTDDAVIVTIGDGGYIITIPKSSPVLPYLTKNLLTADNIGIGDTLLIYCPIVALSHPAQGTSQKTIVLSQGETPVTAVPLPADIPDDMPVTAVPLPADIPDDMPVTAVPLPEELPSVGIAPLPEDISNIDIPSVFADVSTGDWYYNQIMFVLSKGLMYGTTTAPAEPMFEPHATLTRAMAVSVLYRMGPAPSIFYFNVFDDIDESKWYADAVKWAGANGIITNGGSFRPNDMITREELMVMMYNFALYADMRLPMSREYINFADEDAFTAYGLEAAKAMYGAHVITGFTENPDDDNFFKPLTTATRAEFSTMIMKLFEIYDAS